MGPVDQGVKATGNAVFRSLKYPANYKAFESVTLKDGLPLEGKYLYQFCDDTTGSAEPTDTTTHGGFVSLNATTSRVWPNPAGNKVHVESDDILLCVNVLSLDGRTLIATKPNDARSTDLDLSNLSAGSYLVEVVQKDQRSLIRLVRN